VGWLFSEMAKIWDFLMDPGFMFSPLYLPSTVLIVYFVWVLRGRETGFLQFLAPRKLYRHPSTLVDLKVTVFNLFFFSSSLMAALYITPVVTYRLLALLSGVAETGAIIEATTWQRGLAAAVILFLVEDFIRYLNHYLHHRAPVLWPFHAVHHSAEVLTPVTFLRGHPVYYMIQRIFTSFIAGAVQAALLFLVIGQIEFWVLYSGVFAFQVYVFLGAHIRHSHIPLRYGRIAEHILISPAQHQIHHSADPKHFDKNFGEIFALWDWMFGTLYIPNGKEDLIYGVGDKEGRRLAQPYPTLRAALFKPFVESAHAFRQILFPPKQIDGSLLSVKKEQ